jgi:protein O-mannosyl-transferase
MSSGSLARARARLPVLLLCVAGIALYARSLPGPFVFDDVPAIVDNPHVRALWPLAEALAAPPQSSVSGRPLVSLSFALSYAAFGLDPRGWRALNVALHVGCALLLLGIARRTFARIPRLAPDASALALAIALVWLVHPLVTEAVAYVTQRTELLMALAFLGCLYAALRGFERESAGESPRTWFGVAIAAAWLGMAAKESMVAAAPVLLLYDRAFVSGTLAAALRRHRGLYAGVFGSWLGLAASLLAAPRGATVGFGLPVSAWEYALTQIGVVAWYLRLAFWPAPLVIAHDWPIAEGLGEVWPQLCLVALLLAGTAVACVRRPKLGFLGAWLFLVLAPTSSFVPIVSELAAERRMYLALVALVAACALGLYSLLRSRVPGAVLVALSACAALALAGVSAQRLELYRSPLDLWSQVLEVYPTHRLRDHIESAIGQELAHQGRLAEGLPHFELAAQLRPGAAENWANLGRARLNQGAFAGAVDAFTRALALEPDAAAEHANLGLALVRMGRWAEAEPELERALALDPANPTARKTLSRVLVHRGEAAVMQGQLSDAVPLFQRAVELDRSFSAAQQDLGATLMRLQTEPRAAQGPPFGVGSSTLR